MDAYEGGKLSLGQVLVVGPQGGQKLTPNKTIIAEWLQAGGNLLGIGLVEQDANAFLPFQVGTKDEEHVSAYFDPPGMNSFFVGVGPADVHNREPRKLPLVSAGARVMGDGVLAQADDANVIFCQLAPWQFEDHRQSNLKRTRRRAAFLVAV